MMLMLLTSRVYVQGKNQRHCLPVPISRALSLAPSLSCALSLPLQTLDLNLLRIPHRGRQAAVAAGGAVASPAAETPQPQDVPPRLLDRLLRDHSPALHPRYWSRGFSVPGAILRCSRGRGSRRAQAGERECALPGREGGRLAGCTRTHIRSLTHSHARSCWQHGLCSLLLAMRSGELGSRCAPCCEAPPLR